MVVLIVAIIGGGARVVFGNGYYGFGREVFFFLEKKILQFVKPPQIVIWFLIFFSIICTGF